MAVIYDFRKYHTPRLLRLYVQQTGDVVRQLNGMGNNLNRLNAHCVSLQVDMDTFCKRLDQHRRTLQRTLEFIRTCEAACGLSSVEQMIEKRDQIIQARRRQ